MIASALIGTGVAAAAWGGSRLLHRAILRGLRAPRVPHARPLEAGRCALQRQGLVNPQGKRLAAWLAWPMPPSPTRPVPAVLVMHGWGANASMMAPVVEPLRAAGFAVLLLDARCHGDSDDEPFTSMPRFAEDIATGAQWLCGQPGIDRRRIALLGHSVGAAAALLHAAGPAGEAIAAVVSLSAFAHPQELMRRWLAERRLPYPLLGWGLLRHVQRVIGARFDDIAPLHTLPRVRCPVLLVHGRDDATVPFADALRLQRAAQQAGGRPDLLAVAGDHDLRDALAPQAGAIVGFLQRALQEARSVHAPSPAAAPAG